MYLFKESLWKVRTSPSVAVSNRFLLTHNSRCPQPQQLVRDVCSPVITACGHKPKNMHTLHCTPFAAHPCRACRAACEGGLALRCSFKSLQALQQHQHQLPRQSMLALTPGFYTVKNCRLFGYNTAQCGVPDVAADAGWLWCVFLLLKCLKCLKPPSMEGGGGCHTPAPPCTVKVST